MYRALRVEEKFDGMVVMEVFFRAFVVVISGRVKVAFSFFDVVREKAEGLDGGGIVVVEKEARVVGRTSVVGRCTVEHDAYMHSGKVFFRVAIHSGREEKARDDVFLAFRFKVNTRRAFRFSFFIFHFSTTIDY